MPSNAADRGTTRTALASASGCRWRSIRWRVNLSTGSRQCSSAGGSKARMNPSAPSASSPAASRSQ